MLNFLSNKIFLITQMKLRKGDISMKEVLETIIKNLVDNQEDVEVKEVEG